MHVRDTLILGYQKMTFERCNSITLCYIRGALKRSCSVMFFNIIVNIISRKLALHEFGKYVQFDVFTLHLFEL